MSLFNTIATLVKGLMNEADEGLADANKISIVKQNIREARASVANMSDALSTLMAKKKAADRDVNRLDALVQEFTGYAEQASAAGKNKPLMDAATQVAKFTNELDDAKAVRKALDESIGKLRTSYDEAEAEVKSLENGMASVEATEIVQKAQAEIHSGFADANSSVKSAADVMANIVKSQQEKADKVDAALDLQGARQEDVRAALKKAGIKTKDSEVTAEDILNKLAAKKKKG